MRDAVKNSRRDKVMSAVFVIAGNGLVKIPIDSYNKNSTKG